MNLKNVAHGKQVIVSIESGNPDQVSGRLMTDGNMKTKYTPALIPLEPEIDLGRVYKIQGYELEVGMNRFLPLMDRNKRLMIQGSNSADFSNYITLAFIETGKLLFDHTWTLLPVTKEDTFRNIRLKSAKGIFKHFIILIDPGLISMMRSRGTGTSLFLIPMLNTKLKRLEQFLMKLQLIIVVLHCT